MWEVIRKVTKDKFCGDFSQFKIRRACSPTDVFWENYGLTLKEKLVRRISTNVMAMIIIVISFWI